MTRYSILVAEDDHDDQYFIKDAFNRNCNECDVEFVSNGLELTERLEAGQGSVPPALPSIILLDLNMPLKDGYQALKEIKSTPKLKDIPVVVVTSSTRGEDEKHCKTLGCNNFYHKPLSISEYDDLIRHIMQGDMKISLN
jgi:CheY-like chemotaxis protein